MDKMLQTDEILAEDNIQRSFYLTGENCLIPNSEQFENALEDQQFLSEEEEENLVSKFQAQMCSALSETKMKMLEEAQKFILAKNNQSKSLMSQTQQKHEEEMNNFLQKLNRLRTYCESLESGLQTKDALIKCLIEKMDCQQSKLLMSKVFNSWRRYAETKKHKDFISAIALRHYEHALKKRVFHCWRELLKRNWMQRIELRANVEVLQAQKQVVSLYENKIRNLEESLTEAGRKIDTLLQMPRNDLPKTAPSRCYDFSNNNVNFRPTEDVSQLHGYRTLYPRPETSPGALCAECSTQTFRQVPRNCFGYPVQVPAAPPPVSYATGVDEVTANVLPPIQSCHPSSQPKSVPVSCSVNVFKTGSPTRKNDVKKSTKPMITVERHLPRNQMIGGAMSNIVVATHFKNQCHKKTV